MIQLLLDGKLAIPSSNANIKLTTENAYFTKSASYTYDIELPLDIAENREIFGWCQRMDIEKEPRTLEACLIVDNVIVLTGTAHITSIDNKSVKVQLLGEASSYNYGNKMENTYIDELDLGDWYMTTWPDGSYWQTRTDTQGAQGWLHYPAGWRFHGASYRVFERASYNESGEYNAEILIDNLFSGKYPWLAFPVINSTTDIVHNTQCFRFTSSSHNAVQRIFLSYKNMDSEGHILPDRHVCTGAIQPYVWIMAEKIAEATGFKLDRGANALFTNELYRKIFIVNANNHIECNRCLPHWTVNEWWTQIENTFGVVMSLDYASRTMALTRRIDHYTKNAETMHISEVVDEYTCEVDDDTNADISSTSVGFADFDAAPTDLLSEFVHDNARVISDYTNISELHEWAKAQPSSTLSEYKDVIFKCSDGRCFIYSSKDGIVEVDMFRPRYVDSEKKEIDVELKFVPARYVDSICGLYESISTFSDSSRIGSFPVRMLEVPDIDDIGWDSDSESNELDIDSIINGEQDETDENADKPDLIYLGIVNLTMEHHNETVQLSTGGSFSSSLKYPRPFLRERVVAALDDSPLIQDYNYSLSLIPIEGQNNLARHTVADSVKIETKVRYCIKFVADRIPDTSSIFLIHNKRFVCEKIEADIKPSGLSKLMTGYFYEFDL